MSLLKKGEALRRGFHLIEMIIAIVIISILVTIAIPNLRRNYVVANESAAQSNLRVISSALENYATANNGNYPTAESQLTSASPPYLNQSFCDSTVSGYTYSCTLTATSYSVLATPATCGKSGSKTYTITTGGSFSSADCGS